MALLPWLSYIGAILGFLFCTLSLASGLLYIAEVIEEYSKLARTVGQRAIFGIIGLHVLLWAIDGLPLHLIAFGIFCHLVYLTHFDKRTWPYISLTSKRFISSCVLVLANHFLWFFHFSAEAKAVNKYYSYGSRAGRSARGSAGKPQPLGFMEVATLFVFCVWAVPFFLFLTLSANDMVLPSQNTLPNKPDGIPGLNIQVPRERTSILKSVLTKLMAALPSLPRGRHTSRSQKDGLIASPSSSAPPSPIPWNPAKSELSPSQPAASSYFSQMNPPSPHLSPQPHHQGRFPDRLSPTNSPMLSQGPPPPRRVVSGENLRRVETPPVGLVGRRPNRPDANGDSIIDTPTRLPMGKKGD